MLEEVQKPFLVPSSALVLSILLHLSVPVFFATAVLLDKMGVHIFPKKIQPSLYQSFIQVDVIELPEQLINQNILVDPAVPVTEQAPLEAAAPKPAVKETVEEPKSKTPDLPDPSLQASKRTRMREEALKKLEREAKREAALKALSDKSKPGRGKLGGNKLSKGTSSSGAIGTSIDAYRSLVTQAVKKHFRIYPWQKDKNLSAVVKLMLFGSGRIRERSVVKSSGDRQYDASALQAVDETEPYPMPEDLSLIADGFTIELTPEDVQ